MLKKLKWLWKSPTTVEETQQSNLTSSKKTLDNDKLVENVPIIGTPLTSAMNDGKYYLIMGKHRLNMLEFSSHEEVIKYVEQNEMNVILQMIFIVYHDLKELDKRDLNHK